MTITSLTIATLSPFMVADAQEKAVAPEAPAAITYNWQTQTATEGVSEGSFEFGAQGTFSYIPGGNGAMCVDDWHLA